jgi:glycosyltransferase involved in cell wall biosynthesis
MLAIYVHIALFALFVLTFIVQLYYLIRNHNSLANYRVTDELPDVNIPVSVIISARNEARNLNENLPAILQQNYPDFEVVVVNDCSFDSSDVVLEVLKETYPHLKIVTITEHERFKTGKKFALTLGIKAAKNEYLLFTDADCKPASPNWITRMASHFTGEVQMVLGYSPYYKTKGFLNSIVRFETVKTAINYLSAALNRDAYMGVGRNLAYTKTLFFANKGFAAHMHILSGDDDLFVNQTATATNTAIEIHPDAFLFTTAKSSWGALFKQKKRHMGAGKLYKSGHKTALTIDALSGLLFYVLLICFLAIYFEFLPVLGLFVFRWLIQLIIYRKVFKKLNATSQLWYLPFLDFVYYIYINFFGLTGTFVKTTQWK